MFELSFTIQDRVSWASSITNVKWNPKLVNSGLVSNCDFFDLTTLVYTGIWVWVYSRRPSGASSSAVPVQVQCSSVRLSLSTTADADA